MAWLLQKMGLELDQALIVMAALSVATSVFALWRVLLDRAPNSRRAKAIKQRRDDLLQEFRQTKKRQKISVNTVGLAHQVVQRLKLMGGETARNAQAKLAQAGYRGRDATVVFLFAKLALPPALGIFIAMVLFFTPLYPMPDMAKIAVSFFFTGVGYFAADLYVTNQGAKRREKLRLALPDALDLLVICTEAGLNLDSALMRVSRELKSNFPEMAEEFELTQIELGFLPARRQALDNLEMRIDLPAVKALVGTLSQSERYGTPLAQSLKVLAGEMRNERLLKAEEKAARLPAILTMPMIVFIMPSLFIVLIGPGILRTIDGLSGL